LGFESNTTANFARANDGHVREPQNTMSEKN
jgi:hypothetical protein